MRRKDREITSPEEIIQVVENARILHLGLEDKEQPYVVPLYYGYEVIDTKLVFYMHSAKEGRKLDLIRENNRACVQIDNGGMLVSGGEIPCQYGAKFCSVIADGRVEILQNPEEKIHGLSLLMSHQTGRYFAITEEMAKDVAVLKFVSECYTGKGRKG